MIDEQTIRYDYAVLRSSLNERGRRLFAAAQAHALGYGGVAAVARATGIAPSTIGRGLKEFADGAAAAAGRSRRPGGGRKDARHVRQIHRSQGAGATAVMLVVCRSDGERRQA